MTDLKPCPFCGGQATYDTNGTAFWVICKECGAKTAITFIDGRAGKKIVTDRWNRRAT